MRHLIPYARPVVQPPLKRFGDTWSLDFTTVDTGWCFKGGVGVWWTHDNPSSDCGLNGLYSSASKTLDLVAARGTSGGKIRLRAPSGFGDTDSIVDLDVNGLLLRSRADNRLAMPGHTSDPSSLANGDRWRNSTSKNNKHKRETATAADPSVIYVNTAAGTEIASSNAENNFSLKNTIPANSCVAGSMFLILNGGKYSTDASVAVTQTFRQKWGSTTLTASSALSTTLASSNVGWWMVSLLLIVSIGGTGTALCWTFLSNNRNQGCFATAAAVTIATNADADLQESIQMSVSDADNKITPLVRAVVQLW
jgi:hypothetical protein